MRTPRGRWLLLSVGLAGGGALALLLQPRLLAGTLSLASHLRHASPEGFRTIIVSLGPWGPLGTIGLMAAHTLVPFPAELLTVAIGVAYGLPAGLALTWSGWMLGAYSGYFLARGLGRPVVVRLVPDRHLARAEGWFERHGAWGLLALRLMPVISFNLVNYLAGLAGVRLWRFTWTTALGIAPMSILLVSLGAAALADTTLMWVLGAAAGGLVALGLALRKKAFLTPSEP